MLMVDFETLQIKEVEDYMIVDIPLDWNSSFLDEPVSVFTKSLNQKVEYELDKHLFRKPVLFRFLTRLEAADLEIIVNNLVDAIVYYIVGPERKKEANYATTAYEGDRLDVPETLSHILMLDGTIKTCIINKLDTDVFNIQISDKKDKTFFSLTEVAENATEVVIEFKEE
jgi:hypothetical protein